MGLFRIRAFRRLWIGQGVSQIGDFVFASAIMLWIADLLRGRAYAPVVSGASLVVTAAAIVLVSPVAGVLVDRWNKVRVALCTDVVRAVVAAGFVLLMLLGSALPVWLALAFVGVGVTLEAAAALFFNPARFILLSDVVPDDQRGRAAALAQASTAIATIVGPAAGAVIFVNVGPALSFAINALTFVWSFVMIRGAFTGARPGRSAPAGRQSFARELWAPLRILATQPVLRMLLVTGVVVMLGAGTLNALDVYFVAENLRVSPEWYGIISGSFGFGVLAGALLAGAVGARIGYRRLLAGCLVLCGLVFFVYSRSNSPVAAAVAIALYGVSGGCVETTISPLILESVSRTVLARVVSLFGPAFRVASIVSVVSSTWTVSLIPPTRIFTLLGLAFSRIQLVFTGTAVLIAVAGVYAATAGRRRRRAVPPATSEAGAAGLEA